MNMFYRYPALDRLSSELGLEALRNNDPNGIPECSVLMGPDGSGKHYFLEQTIKPMFTANQPTTPNFDVQNWRINKSGEVTTSHWSDENSKHKPLTGLDTFLKRLVYNSSISLLNGIVSLPSLSDCFPELTTNSQNRLIIIENEYQNLALNSWLINYISSNNDSNHYLLVLNESSISVETKLMIHSGWKSCQMPKLTNNSLKQIRCTDSTREKINSKITQVANDLDTTTSELISQLSSYPGLLFSLIGQNDSFDLNKIFKSIASETELQSEEMTLVKLWLSVLDEGVTSDDLDALIGSSNSADIIAKLIHAQLIYQVQPKHYCAGTILKYMARKHPFVAPADAIHKLDSIVKKSVPWNYTLRAAIADRQEHEEGYVNVFRTIDKLQTGHLGHPDANDAVLNTALQMRAAVVDNENPNTGKLRQEAFQLLNYKATPLLQAQLYVILIQFAKKIRVESLLNVAIVKAISVYDELVKLHEYDMMFNLGLELAPDIRNYNLEKYNLVSNKMFSSMHLLLDNRNIKWPEEVYKTLFILLVQHEGVFNNSETQRIQLQRIKELLKPTDVEENLRTLTNLVGIDMCSAIRKDKETQLEYLDDLKTALNVAKNTHDYKAFNNYALGAYSLGRMNAEEAQNYLLEHCYDSQPFEKVINKPIPATSHKIVHINLAMFAVAHDVKNVDGALTMLTIALSNAPQDDFYQFYVAYNRLILRYMNQSILQEQLKEQLLALHVPSLFDGLESGDMLYRRLDYLEQLLESDRGKDYLSLEQAYLEQAQNPTWHRSILSHHLALYSDLQHWD